jgi:hypothetical protein
LLRAPELYGWILAALVGTVFQQSAFRASTLTASLPAMTVAEPVVASVLGVTVLGETLDTPGPQMFVLVAAVVAVVVATTALARGEAATMTADGDGHTAFSDRNPELLGDRFRRSTAGVGKPTPAAYPGPSLVAASSARGRR